AAAPSTGASGSSGSSATCRARGTTRFRRRCSFDTPDGWRWGSTSTADGVDSPDRCRTIGGLARRRVRVVDGRECDDMNPDVVAAIARLRAENVLSSRQAALFIRVARGNLVSIRLEIQVLLYVGVLLLTSGIGLLVVEHHRSIGPVAIAGSIALAAAACLVWVVRRAPPFSWEEVPSPRVAFDYVLLLGLLLFASDLAYVEAQFTVLGPRWAHHLLVVGAVYLLAAYRWDSRTVLGLALTTLAAWRGVSVSLISGSLGAG